MSGDDGANGGATFLAPTDDQVREVLLRIGDMQHRRVFYERLENPLWVAALDSAGAFEGVPTISVDESGYLRSRPWPEGDYLARMADAAPEQVASVLIRFADAENPYVQRVVLSAASNMPPSVGARFVRHLDRHLRSPGRHLLDPVDISEFICSLAAAGEARPALTLANAAYRPRQTSDDAPKTRRNVDVGLDEYWHRKTLPQVVEALRPLGRELLVTLKIWLQEFQQVTGGADETAVSDTSYIWRPSIAPHEQNQGTYEYGDSLVEALVQHAVALIANGTAVQDVVQELFDSRQPLLRRVAMHVLSTADPTSPDSQELATELLLRPELLWADYRHEYAEMARGFLPRLPPEVNERWLEMVSSGPALSEEELRQKARRFQPDEDIETAIRSYRVTWQHSVLSAVGEASLPPQAAERLRSFDEARGPYPHADFPSYVTSGWVGRRSPITTDELAAKSVDDVLALLRTWSPPDDPFGESIEGLADTLGEVVKRRALDFSQRASDFSSLNPTYVRTFARALEEAGKEGEPLDWGAVLTFAGTVISHFDDGADVPGDFDRDTVWRYAQRAAASLIDSGLNEGNAGALADELLGHALEAVAPLARHPDPTPEHEAEYGGSNMDPLTLSLNTTRPVAIRTIARIARRTKVDDPDDRTLQVRTAALDALSARFGHARDPSLAVAAAYGEALASLAWVDLSWATVHVARLRPNSDDDVERAYAEVVATTALSVYRPSLFLLDLVAPLLPPLLQRIADGEPVAVGWRTQRGAAEVIGDHLVMIYVRGDVDLQHPLLVTFFELALAEHRASVLGHLAWSFLHADDVPEAVLTRAMELWDARAAEVRAGGADPRELGQFYWWVRCEKFPPEWWLPRLLEAAERTPMDPHGMIGEHFAQAALADAGVALRVLAVLLRGRDEPFQRYDLVEHAPKIIAAALDSGDAALDELARTTMDALGRGGHLRIAELVEEHRKRDERHSDDG